MKYQEAIKQEMEKLAKDNKVIFIGYNICYGSKAYGTLSDVSNEKKIETPVAENLMAGLAIGLAMEDYKPVLFYERHDFMLIALDSLLNHLDKIQSMSKGEYKSPPVIIRAVVGATKPLYPGLQHLQDFTELFKKNLHFPVIEVKTVQEIKEAYERAGKFQGPIMIIERKDLYAEEFSE
jgi:acetoin:2,6-dichlorophenolindophenol oxidoreductase subunit beta